MESRWTIIRNRYNRTPSAPDIKREKNTKNQDVKKKKKKKKKEKKAQAKSQEDNSFPTDSNQAILKKNTEPKL